MASLIATTDKYGNPQCPWCEGEVAKEGEFCSVDCWLSTHRVIFMQGIPMIEMDYVDMHEQPWYPRVTEAGYPDDTPPEMRL